MAEGRFGPRTDCFVTDEVLEEMDDRGKPAEPLLSQRQRLPDLKETPR